MTASPQLGIPILASMLEEVASLQRWQEWVIDPQYNVAAIDTAYAGHAYTRQLPGMWAAGNIAGVWTLLGNQAPVFRIAAADEQGVLDVFAIAGAIGAQECVAIFKPNAVAGGVFGIPFTLTPMTLLEAAPLDTPTPLACSVMAWVRKRVAGDATASAQFIGFVNAGGGDFNRSSRVARIGIMGDGLLGWRFGSLNCPDANVGGADNGATDIGINSIQPSVLVNPAASWWHVRIKLVPPHDGSPGRFGCYLNGRLVATFTASVNMPRTSRSSIDVSGGAFHGITPCFAMWGAGGSAPGPGFYARDIRVRIEEDLLL